MSENGFPYASMTHPDGQQNPPPQRAPPGDGASGGGGSSSGSVQPMGFQEVAGRGAAFTSSSDPAGVMLQPHQIQLAAATPPAASAAAAAAAATVGVPTAVLHGGVHIPPLPNALLSGNGGSNGIGGMNPDLGEHVFPAHQLFHAAAAAAAAAPGDGGGGPGGIPGPGKSAASTISEGVASAVTGGWFISEPGAGGDPGAAGVGDPVVIPVSLTPQELAARKEMISAETRKQLGVLQDLRAKHAGKRGRYNSADQRVKDDAERAMADLRVNIMPHERQAMSKPVADGGAKSGKKRKKSSNGKASRAGEAACGDPYLANGSGSGMGGCWEDEEEDKEDDDDDDEGDGEGEGEEGEGEDEGGAGDRSRDSATIPPHAKKRLQQIKLLCKRGYLSRAYSCVFYPKGPSASEVKAGAGAGGGARAAPVGEAKGNGVGGGGGGGGLSAPVIYVEAPHMYYQGKVPKMPPCPRHGWQPDGEVESKGWTKGRRVSGVLEDAFLLGTKHVCKLCKQNRLALEESLMACPAAADDAERRRRKEILRKSSYVFRSYDPEVSRMYAQRYPWMASQTSSFVFTKKKAMTHELALLLRQMQGPGAPSAKSPRTAAEREIQVRQAIERVRQAQVALAAEIDAEHRAAMPALSQPAQVPPPPLPAAPAPAAPVGPGPVAPPPLPLPQQVSPAAAAAAAAAAVWGAGGGAGAPPPPPPMMQALAGSAAPPVPAFASSPSGGVGQPGVGGLAGGGPFLSPVLQLAQQQQQQQQQQEEQGSARAQPLPAVTTAMAPAFPFLQAAAVFPPPADAPPPPSPMVPAPPAEAAAAAAKATATAAAVEAVAPGRESDTMLSPVPSPAFSNLEPAPSIGSADVVGDAKETAAAWDMLPKHDNDNHLGLPERAPNSAGQPLPPTGTPTAPPVPAAVPATNGTGTTVGGAAAPAAPAAPGQGQTVREVVAPEGSTAPAGGGEGAGERSSNGTGGAGAAAAAAAALVQSPPPPPPPPQAQQQQQQQQQQQAVPQASPASLPVPSSSSSSSLSATPTATSANVGPWPSAEAGVAATATATTPVPPST